MKLNEIERNEVKLTSEIRQFSSSLNCPLSAALSEPPADFLPFFFSPRREEGVPWIFSYYCHRLLGPLGQQFSAASIQAGRETKGAVPDGRTCFSS
jgi:hypothetical protein